jgi:hypothetical protein
MKVKYSVDKNNRITITKGNDALRPEGVFSVDNDNQLVYKVTESVNWRLVNDVPEHLMLKGKWGIDKDHNLTFTLRKTETQSGKERLLFKTELVKAKARALIFSFGTEGKAGTHKWRLLQLKGKWNADKYNRLRFLVKRLKTTSDTLTLQGSWNVDHNTLVYTYKTVSLKTKKKQTRTLRFQGYWEINSRNRVTYILDTKNKSLFSFRVYLQTPSLVGKKGVIKYRVGIGIKGSRLYKTETITLYGVWKLQRKIGLSLQMDYADGKTKEVRFGAFARPESKTKISFDLKSRDGKDLGISVTFTKTFLKNNAEWFLRAAREGKHSRFEWGITIPW